MRLFELLALSLTFLLACGGGQTASTTPEPVAVAPVEGEATAAAVDVEAPPLAAPHDAASLRTGVAMVQVAGDTERGGASASQRVLVRYRAWDAEGQRLDSGGPAAATANWLMMALPPGLRDGMSQVSPGQTWRFWIPGAETFERAGDVRYEVELLELDERRLSEAPADVAEVPGGATVTATGLASRVLVPGTGRAHPTAESTVTVHYTGWTTDGAMFDSSVQRGREATFPLGRVIAGWTEGVQLMVIGEVRRFWIPANLAYGDNPRRGAPQGMLVFDVELMSMD